MLRRHQSEIDDLLKAIALGHEINKTVLVWVACGGGKSAIPVIAAHRGIPRLGDRICVVTPRSALQEQMEGNFLEGWLRKELGHNLKVRQATNEEDPCAEHCGYVTTYQALLEDEPRAPLFKKINVAEFDRHRYILILDECHHIEEGGATHIAVQPLVDRASLVILMTGTVERADGKRIAYLPYVPSIERGKFVIDEEGPMPVIRYRRRDALGEHAIIPSVFEHVDGMTSYIDGNGQQVMPIPISGAGKRTRESIFTALRTEYARDLLRLGVEDWLGYRRQHPWSKLLIVAPDIRWAEKYLTEARGFGAQNIDIATSKDDASAKRVIRRFRGKVKPTLDAIMTVGMAYEGLDEPNITHTICLTHIRSRAWIEQLLSRGNRPSRHAPYEAQVSYIYTPDDILILDIIDEIRAEEAPTLEEREGSGGGGGGDRDDATLIVPLSGWRTRERVEGLDGDEGITYDITRVVRDALKDLDLVGVINPLEAWQIHTRLSQSSAPPEEPGHANTAHDAEEELTPSVEEESLRQLIEKYCRAWDSENDQPFGTLNGVAYAHFGKSRKNMGATELRAALKWLKTEYPRQRSA